MKNKEKISELIYKYKKKYALERPDENIIVAVHLMNEHHVDKSTALDQSSNSGDDEGIDGWFFNSDSGELFIYQSKLSDSKNLALKGLADLERAKFWIESLLIDGEVEKRPTSNQCLYNLAKEIAKSRDQINKVNFCLLTIIEEAIIEDYPEFEQLKSNLVRSPLNQFIKQKKGVLQLNVSTYNLEETIPHFIKEYEVTKLTQSTITTTQNSRLDLAYISLYNLIDLYRERGDILFNKNIRLSIQYTKDAKARLVHPMEETLTLICTGKLDPNFFPFYHVGVTIAASEVSSSDNEKICLKDPSVINGCQTITIANNYLSKLEKKNKEDMIKKFKDIKVVAKIITGTSDDELREITNSNNRQSPIDNWQLFSNEPVHIEIESSLKDKGIFYERQRGKFEALFKKRETFLEYQNTNGTYIEVVTLGQIICLARGFMQWAAKPSEIFVSKSHHEQVFTFDIKDYSQDIIFLFNFLKAAKRSLFLYLEQPTHKSNDYTHKIFIKPYVRSTLYYLALLYAYQNMTKFSVKDNNTQKLMKTASPNLVDEFSGKFYPKVISKFKIWYLKKSKNMTEDNVKAEEIDSFTQKIGQEIGINFLRGDIPLSNKSFKWFEINKKQ